MEIFIFMIMTSGEVKVAPRKLKVYESCSEKVEKIMEEYKAPVQVYWCTTKNGKYYVSYYNPQFEKEKEKVKK